MNSVLALFVFGWVTSFLATANYICVCNRGKDVRSQVFDSAHSSTGHLDPNECAAFLNNSKSDQGWFSIEFNQEIAFIEEKENIVIDECTGTSYQRDTDSTRMPITNTMSVPSSNTPPTPTSGPTKSPNKTISPALLGNVLLCPPYVIQGAKANGYLLTQHNHACYEVCQDKVSWTHAHMLCTERGGHLVTLHSDKENTYLHHVLQQVYNHTVWIGLQDGVHEEHFEWTTGEKVTYTNWRLHHRKSPNHNHEDCVLMLRSGLWDDVECGANYPSNEAAQMTHSYVCEYKTHSSGSFIVG